MNDIDLRRARLSTRVKWGIGLVAALLVAPVAFLIIQGMAGLAVALIGGLALVNFAPVLAMKFANWKLKAVKAEARSNPIETRQQVALARHTRIGEVERGIEAFGAEVRNVADEVKNLRKNGQPEDADALEAEHVKLQEDFDAQVADLGAAKNALAEFELETARLGRRWKAAEALLRARGASGKEVSKELEKLVSQEATDAVNTKMNQAFASLDVSRASRRQNAATATRASA